MSIVGDSCNFETELEDIPAVKVNKFKNNILEVKTKDYTPCTGYNGKSHLGGIESVGTGESTDSTMRSKKDFTPLLVSDLRPMKYTAHTRIEPSHHVQAPKMHVYKTNFKKSESQSNEK